MTHTSMVNKQTKRISTKILKMNENNQHSQAMTKPSVTEFNRILDKIFHDDNIGYLFIVDIKFHDINPKTLLFNEIYPPTFEKNKKMEPFEQSTLQLMSIMVRNEDEDKDQINSFRYTLKTHSTLKDKNLSHSMLKTNIF